MRGKKEKDTKGRFTKSVHKELDKYSILHASVFLYIRCCCSKVTRLATDMKSISYMNVTTRGRGE